MAKATGATAHTANKNRALRQEALRESLEAGGHIQHVLDICKDLNDLAVDMDAVSVQRKRAVIDTKMKLIGKYLPDTKSVAPIVDFDFNKSLKPHQQAAQVMDAISLGKIPPDVGSVLIQSVKNMIDLDNIDIKDRLEKIEALLNDN